MEVSKNGKGAIPPVVPNSTAQVTQSNDSEAQLQKEVRQLSQDVYHKESTQESTPTYSKPMTLSSSSQGMTKTMEESLYEIGLATVHLYTSGGDVHQAAETMFSQYEKFMTELASEQPALAEKDWGISINKSGKLEVSGSLTGEEKAFIEAKLNDNKEFVSAASDFKSSFLKYAAMESRGWGDFDVNDSNFSEVFDFKEMLERSQGDEEFKKHWGKSFSFLELNENISSQLRRNT